MGGLIGIETRSSRLTNIWMLTNLNLRISNFKPIKLITNRSIYNLKISRYEGHITDIVKTNNLHKKNPKYLPKYSSLREIFPMMHMKNKNYHNRNNSENVEKAKRHALEKIT